MATVPNTDEGPLSVTALAAEGETLAGATSSALLVGNGDFTGGVVRGVEDDDEDDDDDDGGIDAGGPIADATTIELLVVVLVLDVDETDVELLLDDNSNSFFTSTGVSLLGTMEDCCFAACCIGPGEDVGVGVRTMVVSPTCCTGLGTNRFCSSEGTFLVVTVTLTPVCNTDATVEVVCVVTASRFMMVMFVSEIFDADEELTDTGTVALVCS